MARKGSLGSEKGKMGWKEFLIFFEGVWLLGMERKYIEYYRRCKRMKGERG